MMKIVWNDRKFDFGDQTLNLQNQHIADLINMLSEKPSLLEDTEFIVTAIEELLDYSREYFTQEEELLGDLGCRFIEEHKTRNWGFLTQLSEL
ncbi:hypothetical protein MTBPR1_10167 [Candidatus Terasakiella magnetica]|uniref:Hemerythrin-like domain-containing protein n=1 Tax=Candidatus Terasakiella magnetica TaxID=1867952 RepID=A0A1C3RCC2_9PROT|nr:hypothetical protein [Candidatus Terasakiella magnetica]SCA54920.1 hypothetical protein MTBPR1_10167 [Candidatus Terasakiella magnetica]